MVKSVQQRRRKSTRQCALIATKRIQEIFSKTGVNKKTKRRNQRKKPRHKKPRKLTQKQKDQKKKEDAMRKCRKSVKAITNTLKGILARASSD